MKFAICIPTYNAEDSLPYLIESYYKQNIKASQFIIIDSSSTDKTCELAQKAGFQIHLIDQSDFNHGSTRNLFLSFLSDDIDVIVFMTQDVIFTNENSLKALVSSFSWSNISAAYGRQLPHQNANPLACHARFFNYPESSLLKSVNNIDQLGIKTFFISNSFSAYRLSTFRAVGGFPQNVILAEDMYICAKMIYAGFEVLYNADACVNHSHNYSIKQEFQRYFDTGVFHEQQPWITQKIPRVSNEGFKFVLSELVFLWKNHPVWIPFSIIYTFVKWLGFNLGKNWYRLPSICLMWFSMHKNFWK